MGGLIMNSFGLMIGGAFIGGLILNFMPCVLPVLALKFYAINRNAGDEGLKARTQTAWLIAGIIISFNLFAGLVYGLKQAGAVIGWGFHFQQPIFVLAIMVLLLFFVFLQLGYLTIDKIGTTGQGFANRVLYRWGGDKAIANLFYGGLIVLLATPCTAPFLGSAVAFALTQNLATISIIFTSIGFGLAMPWILFLILPIKDAKIFNSGDYKNITKIVFYVMTALLYGSALWMLFVLAGQLGAFLAVALFLLLHFGLFFWQYLNRFNWQLKILAPLAILAIIISPLILPKNLENKSNFDVLTSKMNWHQLDPKQIRVQASKGKIVFVDITADWCLTCQFNKANILLDKEVQVRLAQKDIYLMRGDLTKPNSRITKFLKSQGRIGIPFNAIYNKHQRIILSEILDKKTLLDGLAKN